jgi:hypothetical protein
MHVVSYIYRALAAKILLGTVATAQETTVLTYVTKEGEDCAKF